MADAQGLTPFEVKNFAGGITDEYLGGAQNEYEICENLLINADGKPYSRPGSQIFDEDYPQIPAGAQRIGTLINYDKDSELLIQSATNVYYIDGGWQTLQGPGTNAVFTAGTTANIVSHSAWNKHVFLTHDGFPSPMKIYRDQAGDLQVRNAGLPEMAAPTCTHGTVGTAKSYIYAFCYFYEYQVGTGAVTFQDFGPTTRVTVQGNTDIDAGAANTVAITSIPSIASGTENYDTANIKVKIYRSENNGTTLYYVGQVNNGTTTFNDTTTDPALVAGNLPIYTTGGVPDNDPPPKAKFVHIAGDIALWGHVKEGSETLGNRVVQGQAGDPDSAPAGFFDDMDEDVTGISSVAGTIVVFTANGVNRMEGVFDELGRNGLSHKKIADTIGSVNHQGIVQTPEGLFFFGDDGIYFTDAYQVKKVSDGWNETYKTLVDTETKRKRIVGTYDPKQRMVHWAVQSEDANSDNDAILTLHLRFGIRARSCFTFSFKNGTSFAPTFITYFNKKLIRADRRGYIFQHDDTLTTDPKVDTGVAASNWITKAIIFRWRSAAFNFGTDSIRKFIPSIAFQCLNESNLSLQIISINDDGRSTRELVPLRFRGNVTWGDTEVVWGDPTLVWNYDGIIEEKRRFPAGGLRCSYKQVEFTNAYSVVTNSDSIGVASVDTGAKTCTLDSPASSDWPSNAVDYYLSFESDDYERQYLITARTNDTLTFSDSGNHSVPGSQKWVIKGYPKGEIFHLISFTLYVAPFSKTQDSFQRSEAGGNA
jgi:hypothetical protein